MKRSLKYDNGGKVKPQPKARLYSGTIDDVAKTKSYVTPEYLQEVDKRRSDWNEFVEFLKKENVAGSEALDKSGAGLGYLKKWNKLNPDKSLTEDDIKDVQYYARGKKKQEGERVTDGILGKVTSTFTFPDSKVNTYEMKDGKKVLVKSEKPNIGNYRFQADKINFNIAAKAKDDVSKLPIYNPNSSKVGVGFDKDESADNLLKEQVKKRSLSGQSFTKPQEFVKPMVATENHPAAKEQLEGSYFDNNQKVVDYNNNLQQQKQAEIQQQIDTRTALQKKFDTSRGKDFTKEEAIDYFIETGKVLPQNKVQAKYAKNDKGQILDVTGNPYKVTSEYKTPFKIEVKNFGKNTKDEVSDALLDIKNIGKPGVNLYGKPTKGYSLFQFAKIPLNLLEATAAPVKGLIESTEIRLPTKRKLTKVNEEFGMPSFEEPKQSSENLQTNNTFEYGGTINNMKKRTLKRYTNAGLVSGVGKTAAGASTAGAVTTGATVSPNAIGTGIGFGAEIIGGLIPDKSYTDSEGNDLGSRKSIGESTLEYGAKGAAITAMLGGADLGIATALGAGYGAIKGWTEKDEMEQKQKEAENRITNKRINRIANTNVNWGDPSVNTSTNMMFAQGGMVLDYDDPNANAELELQETFQMPDGTVGNVDGPSHEMGGIAVDLPEGTRIWSDKLRHNGKTFAKHTKPITSKIAKLEKEIEKNPNNVAKQNSVALLNDQLDYYFNVQEANKQEKEMKRTFRKGGLVKYFNGGEKNPYDPFNQAIEYQNWENANKPIVANTLLPEQTPVVNAKNIFAQGTADPNNPSARKTLGVKPNIQKDPLVINPNYKQFNPFNKNEGNRFSTPYAMAYETDPNIPKGQPRDSTAGAGMDNLGFTPETPSSNWLKDNSGLVGQLGTAALSAGIQSNRINKLARPKTLAGVRLTDKVVNPSLVDYSAERNAIDRTALNAMSEAQKGFGSSAATQAFKNKARLNQLEGTGRSFQSQENTNTQIKNQFLGAQQEAAMKEAMINNEIDKYNLENTYGFDTMKAGQKNAITAMLANTAGQTFGKQTEYKNQLDAANILSNQYDPSVINDMIKNGKLKYENGKLVKARNDGTIKKRSFKK